MDSENNSTSLKTALESIESLMDQCLQAWNESHTIEFKDQYSKIENIIVCGMGGSALPVYIINSVFSSSLPIYINENYHLPSWAGPKTLILLASYSGDTEEILSCAKQATDQNCLITGVTSGGQLGEFLKTGGYPFYSFEPKYNSSGFPRYGIGYGVFGMLGLLSNLKIIETSDLSQQIIDSVEHCRSIKDEIKASANGLAKELKEKTLVIFTTEHLDGNGHTFANQLNETSKSLAFWSRLPDGNHSLIEAFKNADSSMAAFFIESQQYSARMQERFNLTRQVIEKNGYATSTYQVKKGTLVQEMLEVLFLTSFLSLQIAVENGVDPLAIPSVDFIKSHLSKLVESS